MMRQTWRGATTPKLTIGVIVTLGLTGVFIAIFIPNAYTRIIPTFVLVGATVAAVGYRRGFPSGQPSLPSARLDWTARSAYLATYFGLIGAITILYLLSGGQRPLSVHLLTVGLYGLIAVSVLVFDSGVVSLGLLLTAGIFHRATVYFVGAVPLGNDALFHTRVATEVVATGSLGPLITSKYWYAPLYHLTVGLTSVGLDLPAREAAFLVVAVPATAVPPLVIFGILRRYWSEAIGVVGAFVYVVSDHAILSSVHVTPSSLGVVFFGVILWSADRYLRGEGHSVLAIYVGTLLALVLTHQLSLFVTLVMVGIYLAGTTVLRGGLGPRETLLGTLLVTAFLLQSLYTRYGGPAGEEGSFLMTVAPSIIQALGGGVAGGGRTAAYPPPSANVAVSGADALTAIQVLGMGLLFGAAVVGIVLWMSHRTSAPLRQGFCMTAVVAVATGLVFGPPTLGVNVFIPGRWFPFIYVGLALLAAPGIGLLIARGSSLSTQPIVPALVVLTLTLSLAGVMTMNGYGAADDPVFDDAAAASRISTTSIEAAGYEFVIERSGEVRMVTDFGAWRVMERYFGHPVSVYRTQYGEQGTVFDGPQLLVYRQYASTDHASYYLEYQDREFRVYGPIPVPAPPASTVYDNGDVRVYYLAA